MNVANLLAASVVMLTFVGCGNGLQRDAHSPVLVTHENSRITLQSASIGVKAADDLVQLNDISPEYCSETEKGPFQQWAAQRTALGQTCKTLTTKRDACGTNGGWNLEQVRCEGAASVADNVCDENGELNSWLLAKASQGATGCTAVKLCPNCCATASPWYFVSCTSLVSAATAPVAAPVATQITGLPLKLVSLTPNFNSTQSIGAPLQFTALASDGVPPYQYKWWIYDGSWQPLSDWGSSSTYIYTPTHAHSDFKLGVWVRSANSQTDASDNDASNGSVPFAVDNSQYVAPVETAPVIRVDVANPSVGETIRVEWEVGTRAAATGGIAIVDSTGIIIESRDLSGVASGGVSFSAPATAGDYEIVYYSGNVQSAVSTSETRAKISTVEPVILVNNSNPIPGQPLTVNWNVGQTAAASGGIAIVDSHGVTVESRAILGLKSGSTTFSAPLSADNYNVVFYSGEVTNAVVASQVKVRAVETPSSSPIDQNSVVRVPIVSVDPNGSDNFLGFNLSSSEIAAAGAAGAAGALVPNVKQGVVVEVVTQSPFLTPPKFVGPNAEVEAIQWGVVEAGKVKISPDVVAPKIAPSIQKLFEVGPNLWVQAGNPEGSIIYQRGLSGDYSIASSGFQEALDFVRGEFDPMHRAVSKLESLSSSTATAVETNSMYSDPLTIRGRVPELSGMPYSEYTIHPGARITSVEAIGTFTRYSEPRKWAQNYLDLQAKLVEAGMEIPVGSRGDRFTNELKQVMSEIKVEVDPNVNAQRILNGAEIDTKITEIFERYPADLKVNEAIAVATPVETTKPGETQLTKPVGTVEVEKTPTQPTTETGRTDSPSGMPEVQTALENTLGKTFGSAMGKFAKVVGFAGDALFAVQTWIGVAHIGAVNDAGGHDQYVAGFMRECWADQFGCAEAFKQFTGGRFSSADFRPDMTDLVGAGEAGQLAEEFAKNSRWGVMFDTFGAINVTNDSTTAWGAGGSIRPDGDGYFQGNIQITQLTFGDGTKVLHYPDGGSEFIYLNGDHEYFNANGIRDHYDVAVEGKPEEFVRFNDRDGSSEYVKLVNGGIRVEPIGVGEVPMFRAGVELKIPENVIDGTLITGLVASSSSAVNPDAAVDPNFIDPDLAASLSGVDLTDPFFAGLTPPPVTPGSIASSNLDFSFLDPNYNPNQLLSFQIGPDLKSICWTCLPSTPMDPEKYSAIYAAGANVGDWLILEENLRGALAAVGLDRSALGFDVNGNYVINISVERWLDGIPGYHAEVDNSHNPIFVPNEKGKEIPQLGFDFVRNGNNERVLVGDLRDYFDNSGNMFHQAGTAQSATGLKQDIPGDSSLTFDQSHSPTIVPYTSSGYSVADPLWNEYAASFSAAGIPQDTTTDTLASFAEQTQNEAYEYCVYATTSVDCKREDFLNSEGILIVEDFNNCNYPRYQTDEARACYAEAFSPVTINLGYGKGAATQAERRAYYTSLLSHAVEMKLKYGGSKEFDDRVVAYLSALGVDIKAIVATIPEPEGKPGKIVLNLDINSPDLDIRLMSQVATEALRKGYTEEEITSAGQGGKIMAEVLQDMMDNEIRNEALRRGYVDGELTKAVLDKVFDEMINWENGWFVTANMRVRMFNPDKTGAAVEPIDRFTAMRISTASIAMSVDAVDSNGKTVKKVELKLDPTASDLDQKLQSQVATEALRRGYTEEEVLNGSQGGEIMNSVLKDMMDDEIRKEALRKGYTEAELDSGVLDKVFEEMINWTTGWFVTADMRVRMFNPDQQGSQNNNQTVANVEDNRPSVEPVSNDTSGGSNQSDDSSRDPASASAAGEASSSGDTSSSPGDTSSSSSDSSSSGVDTSSYEDEYYSYDDNGGYGY